MRKRMFLLLLLLSGLYQTQNLYGQFKVIGYLPTWNGYPNSIDNVDLTKLTHLNIAFANPNSSGDLNTAGGTLTNLATVVNTAHASNVKVLMSIGGAGAPGTIYTSLITNNLNGFVSKIVQYTIDNNLDGIDVDIEGDVLNGSTMNSAQYSTFITALQTGLHAQNKLMTAALATWFAGRVADTTAAKFDFINLMSYDEYGTWTGPGQHSSYAFAVDDLDHWTNEKGIPASKLTVGVPFYGYYWGTSSSASRFANIVSTYPGAEYKDQVNPTTGGVLYYNGIPTIKQKTVLALEEAGGIMIWELTQDATGTKSLLSAIDEVIDGYATNTAPSVTINSPADGTTYTEGDTISIDITANDTDGSIMKTEYFSGTFKIGEQYGAPTIMKWANVGPGIHSLTVRTTDNIGASTLSAAISITVNAAGSSLPFTGTALPIPGKIEAENFNLGGNGVSYSDVTVTNEGGAYRTGRVDIEVCSDNGGGYDIGWTSAGEWLEYTVEVASAGQYDFQTRVATPNSNKTFYIQIDGVNVTGTITVSSTTGWQKWQTVTASNIFLTQGIKKMRIVFITGDFNINYVNTVVATPTSIIPTDLYKNSNTIYPNPVRQSSILHFNLKQSGNTRIILCDEQGKEQLQLTNQFMNAGEHELVLDRSTLPNGIYFCRIMNEGEIVSMKVVME